MLFAPEDQVCGVPASMAREAVRIVESAQWCSAGALASELHMDVAASRSLLEALEAEGRLARYTGRLPDGHDGWWLPGEETSEEQFVLWHLRYLEGKALAKARIGSPVPRSVAEGLLADVLDRVRAVNSDPAASHAIERVLLYGSLTAPGRETVSDVDLLVVAHRRGDRASLGGGRADPASPNSGNDARRLPEDEAVSVRMRLEELLRAGDERLDVSVIDESSNGWSPLPDGARKIEVFPGLGAGMRAHSD